MPTPLPYVQDGDWEGVRRNFTTTAAKLNPAIPQARVYHNTTQSITNNTATACVFNSEHWDEGALHSTSANTSRLTASVTGLWLIGGSIRFASNATGIRQSRLLVNNTTIIGLETRAALGGGNATDVPLTPQEWRLVAGDYVELIAYQDSGGALNVLNTASYTPEFWMHRVAGYVEEGL